MISGVDARPEVRARSRSGSASERPLSASKPSLSRVRDFDQKSKVRASGRHGEHAKREHR